MPRRTVSCDDVVFDALVFDRYGGAGTNKAELRRKLEIVYKAMKNELTDKEFMALKEYYIFGRKMKDIALDRGVHPSTVTRQIRNARNKIIRIASYY